jgi:hypothetical protein
VADETGSALPIAGWRTALARLIVWETRVTIGAAFQNDEYRKLCQWTKSAGSNLRVTTSTPKHKEMRGMAASSGAAHVGVPAKQLAAARYRWDREAAVAGERRRVFCMSLGDFWDNQVPDEWRIEALNTVRQ